MGEVEDLIRERNRLRSEREVRESMKSRNLQRKQLKAEIRREKHAGLYSFGRTLGNVSARAAGAAIKYAEKKAAASRKMKRSPRKSSRVPRQKPMSLSQALYGY